ncbi:3-ketosteroid-delta-1-dehydrogenase [Lysinibacillus sphaericus]|uniref:3-ketosteroid-delta-1-dehydrogenase n=3 Tax=Lysinibacillus TaxID=400634 RepID=A0A2S0JXI5_LYSSH|nr:MULTISPECIES: NUMOD4 domain-containing protein [Lysinibacillus]AHN23098.1 3-ketosteroid-delta-1-dehydrogenase [Lysinibacillus varians]AVK95674.1 3-ketosteroid-delta-1-dehydrogenase [Lysinibacillus sphaericus]MCS1382889.1 3-ketosteroid-delta-1-dehydrogenase [Lysinibacillus sphaericus]MED4545649.1 3-ketosteroid-delta-1-dehydrogenase [Lysinibacillus sphaericus]TKI17558.1 3-ketosteroid-delta-1-dehydrogenase [Lysinibacillus sphaericus]
MTLTKQQALQALNKNKFIGFTITTGNIIMKKVNKTDYNIFVYEEGSDKPLHYVGSIMNVMATMSDKASNKDFIVVDQLPEEQEPEAPAKEQKPVDKAVIKTTNLDEESRAIAGYEGLYEITASGRIMTVRENRPLARCNDEYGFHIVRLTKDGTASNHNVFELWKQTFPELEQTHFKGALKAKYGTGCKLIDKPGIHF